MLQLALYQVHKDILPRAQHPCTLGVDIHCMQHRICPRQQYLRHSLKRLQTMGRHLKIIPLLYNIVMLRLLKAQGVGG